jgi:hypothetical protein
VTLPPTPSISVLRQRREFLHQTPHGGFMKNLFISLVIGLGSLTAIAQVGQVAIGGSGCPQGDVYFDSVEDKILVHYNKMNVNNDDGKTISRVSCNLRLPISVPAGTRLVSELESDAAVDVRANNKVILSQELFVVGSSEIPSEEQIQHHHGEVLLSSLTSTTCGSEQEIILAYNLNATLMNLSKHADSSAFVSKSALTIKFESCFDSENSVGDLQDLTLGN